MSSIVRGEIVRLLLAPSLSLRLINGVTSSWAILLFISRVFTSDAAVLSITCKIDKALLILASRRNVRILIGTLDSLRTVAFVDRNWSKDPLHS